jgi:hypothetical protein
VPVCLRPLTPLAGKEESGHLVFASAAGNGNTSPTGAGLSANYAWAELVSHHPGLRARRHKCARLTA